jgi:hypothetical protein
MCSYHGWRFNGEGECTRIPQALDPRAEQAACSSSRSCASSHPTQVCTLIGCFCHWSSQQARSRSFAHVLQLPVQAFHYKAQNQCLKCVKMLVRKGISRSQASVACLLLLLNPAGDQGKVPCLEAPGYAQ